MYLYDQKRRTESKNKKKKQTTNTVYKYTVQNLHRIRSI